MVAAVAAASEPVAFGFGISAGSTESVEAEVDGTVAIGVPSGLTICEATAATAGFAGAGYVEGTLFPWTISDFSVVVRHPPRSPTLCRRRCRGRGVVEVAEGLDRLDHKPILWAAQAR
jgi:hypothetical protein